MSNNKHEALDAFIATLGLQYLAQFVPQKMSRNSAEEQPSLNWRVMISKGARSISADYMQGIGHVPGYLHKTRLSLDESRLKQAQEAAANTGKYPDVKQWGRGFDLRMSALPAPELRDVLYSLVMDADVLNSRDFEDWASSYGYDADSRKAERIYTECLRIARELESLLGRDTLAKLQELYQDY